MRPIQVYLFFQGACEEALHFYQSCFGGDISIMSRFKDGPEPVDAQNENKIMHAEFQSGELRFMASDGPKHPTIIGNNIQLALDFKDVEHQTTVFNKLAQGGEITMPLADTFWGAHFGMLKDKFGIYWMLNCDTKS